MLVISCVVIIGAFSLTVHANERVGPIGFSDVVLPPLCMAREWFGVRCPGCGLTRSFIYLAQGEWQASWTAHHLGWLLAILLVLQIPYRIHGLCYPRQAMIPSRVRWWIGNGLIAMLILNWMFDMVC
jgi:hypothetical protein